MESPIPRYAETRKASRKGSSPRTSPPPEYTEKTTYIKFLVSNAEAGSVIGKRGSTINDFQSQSGARIQISGNQEFFPGTSDRIIMVSGTFDEILKALELILVRLVNEFYAEDGDHADIRSKVRLVAANSSCGGIIGKGGATIRSFIKDSRAGIKVSPQDNSYIGLNDRTVTIDGTLEEIMRAVELILLKFTEDPQYARSFGVPFSYASVMFAGFTGVPHPYMLPPVAAPAYGAINYGPDRARGKFQNNKEDRGNSVTIGVADEHIGLVVGRGGRNLMEISQVSGARIKISDRGDFISGTSNRKVTITGSQKAIRIAEAMIYYKAASVSES